MKSLGHLAIIGSGASTIYLLHHIERNAANLRPFIRSITIHEKRGMPGCGMPYNPETTDRYNMSNISSEEIPALPQSLHEWLGSKDAAELSTWGIEKNHLSESEVYGRLPLGQYLHAQYKTTLSRLAEKGIPVEEKTSYKIVNITGKQDRGGVTLLSAAGERSDFDSVIIATGHQWNEMDRPEHGYYASPWPIFKLLPEEGRFFDFTVGTLGASLSAFDVVSSLAHRHGTFSESADGTMSYAPFPGTEKFQIRMHSANGWLPHLQFDQKEPFREIYRHTDREAVLSMLDGQGFLRIATFFDLVCRPALRRAFEMDGMSEIAALLRDPGFTLKDFVEKMGKLHTYVDAFEGMRTEMVEACRSVLDHKPVHWKEVIDDLMFSLNFHAEMMPAEDHITFRKIVMPFLMNVIAAMPLPSGNLLLAMHDAGKLELVAGYVRVDEKQEQPRSVSVTIEHEGETTVARYGIFVDCSGQKPLELEDYPFQSLVESGEVRRARARFLSPPSAGNPVTEGMEEHVFREGGQAFLHTGGIDIDACYRVIGSDGSPSHRIYDFAFPHTSGVRPYSYGLQACEATASTVVHSWMASIEENRPVDGSTLAVTEVYEEI